MRENIGLFKAKRIDNGEWVQGYVNGYCYIDSERYIKSGYNEQHQVIPETLCECTGLKDKNGKLIFENDIVRYIYEPKENESFGYVIANELGIISFKSTGFYFKTIKGTNKYAQHAGWLVSIPHSDGNLFEIIGNKFSEVESE